MPNHQSNPHVARRQQKFADPSARLSNKPGKTHPGIEVCKGCGAVHYHDRWYTKEHRPPEAVSGDTAIHETLCEGCRQIRDHNPGGVLTLAGAFLESHADEIMSLIHNEDHAAQGINPLEKVMEIDRTSDDYVTISTTNEFLAQRIGKAIHRAYSGEIEYKFGGSDIPVRVLWRRD